MLNEAAFLDAIKAGPEDQVTRLVYADWLEERGESSRSEYVRLNEELLALIGSAALKETTTQTQIRRLRGRLRKIGTSIDPAWVAIFDALRPVIFHCCQCRKTIVGKDAIDTNPRTQLKMKNTRYCKICWEDAIRAYLHHGSGLDSYSGRRSADADYHGSGDLDD